MKSKRLDIEVRCCALVVGSTSQNLHELLPTLEREMSARGMPLVAPPTPLRSETVEDALAAASRADVCLLVFERDVTAADTELLRELGILEIHGDEGGVYLATTKRQLRLPTSLENSFPVCSLDDEDSMERIQRLAIEHMELVRDEKSRPLSSSVSRWRDAWRRGVDRRRGERRGEAQRPVMEQTPTVPEQATSTAREERADRAEPNVMPPPEAGKSPERTSSETEPMPASGPVLYVSYAYEPSTEAAIFETTRELRRRGYRAQVDKLGFVHPREAATNEQRYRGAVMDSEWFVLFITNHYVMRSGETWWTGVKVDMRNIGEKVLMDPFMREKVVPVMVGTERADADGLPGLVLGLDRLVVSAIEPVTTAGVIHRGIQKQEKAQTRPVPIAPLLAMPQSELVQAIVWHADWIAQGSTWANKRIPVGALVLGMIHYGMARRDEPNSTAWLAAQYRASGGADIRQMVSEYFANWNSEQFGIEQRMEGTPTLELSYNSYSLLFWARLLAERTNGSNEWRTVHAVHVLVALLHPAAPWTANVEKALELVGLEPIALRRRLSRDLATWNVDGDTEAWQPWIRMLAGQRLPGEGDGSGRGGRHRWRTGEGAAGVSADDPRVGEDHLDITPDVEAFAKVLASWKLEPPLALGLFGDWGSGKTFFMKRLKKEIEGLSRKAREAHTIEKLERAGALIEVKVPTRQRDEAYCKYIAQVEFNAWHYSEGDLWACLVDHIFTNLRVTDQDSRAEISLRLKALLTQLQDLENKGEAKAQAVKIADAAVQEAKKKADAASEQLEKTKSAYNAEAVKDIWDVVVQDPKLHEAVKAQLERAGMNPQNLTNAKAIRETIEDAKSLASRGKHVFGYLFKQWNNPLMYVAFVLAFVVPAGLIWAIELKWVNETASKFGVSLTAVLSVIAGAVPVYRAAAGRIEEVLGMLERPREMAEAHRQARLKEIDAEVKRLTDERNAAQAEQAAIEAQKVQVQQQIDSLSASRMMAEFLQERASSGDYRSKLGTLALIRRDFERLADLMSNQRVEANKEVEPTPAQYLPREEADEPEEIAAARVKHELEQLRVNRIVLYIDDLDRCSPAQVVKVLQAIHLLLAFPLFVVVVGVDARWVHRSILIHCKELLGEGDVSSADDREDEQSASDESSTRGSYATTHDYLEKIFQVPFWLREMSIDACQTLIEGIVRPKASSGSTAATGLGASELGADSGAGEMASVGAVAATSSSTTTSETTSGDPARGAAGGVSTKQSPARSSAVLINKSEESNVERDTEGKASTQAGSTAANSRRDAVKTDSAATAIDGILQVETPGLGTQQTIEAKQDTGGNAISTTSGNSDLDNATKPASETVTPIAISGPQSLELNDDEVLWMKELAPIVGRSPRAVKRFVNCYRLFKAVLPEDLVGEFVKRRKDGSSYAQISLFFLAMIVGEPGIAGDVLGRLQSEDDAETFERACVSIAGQMRLGEADTPPRARLVGRALKSVSRGHTTLTVGDVRRLVDRSLRFSFRSSMMMQATTRTRPQRVESGANEDGTGTMPTAGAWASEPKPRGLAAAPEKKRPSARPRG